MPLIRSGMDAEVGHKFAVKALASGFAPRDMATDDEALGVEVRRISSTGRKLHWHDTNDSL